MRELIGNIIEIIIYGILFIFLALISLKIIGSIFSSDFEREIKENKNIGLSIILSSLLLALAILFLSIIR